jgi:hypothetical protein
MRVLTIKSASVLDEEMQTEVHHVFGMEHHTDYVFKPRGDQKYSATIVLEDTEPVIKQMVSASTSFPDLSFVIDDLDMESNSIERYHVSDGNVKEQLRSGWKWEE